MVYPESPEIDALKAIPHQTTSGLRNEHLPTVARGLDSCGSVDRRSDVIVISSCSRACVDTHADFDPANRGIPNLSEKPPLCLHRAGYGIGRVAENGHQPVTHLLDHVTTATVNSTSDHMIVPQDCLAHHIGRPFPSCRAANYIGE
jgi:hypothetical protein